MQCRILSKKGHVVAVSWLDGADWKGAIIPHHYASGRRIGDTIELSTDVLHDGLDHGIWFDLFMPEEGYTITPDTIQNAMRGHGIWTYEDLVSKPQEVQAAILSVVRVVYGQLVKAAREHYGG
jgi:hypothetical protein